MAACYPDGVPYHVERPVSNKLCSARQGESVRAPVELGYSLRLVFVVRCFLQTRAYENQDRRDIRLQEV